MLEELYLEMLRVPLVLEGFRHVRAAARACGPHGIIYTGSHNGAMGACQDNASAPRSEMRSRVLDETVEINSFF